MERVVYRTLHARFMMLTCRHQEEDRGYRDRPQDKIFEDATDIYLEARAITIFYLGYCLHPPRLSSSGCSLAALWRWLSTDAGRWFTPYNFEE